MDPTLPLEEYQREKSGGSHFTAGKNKVGRAVDPTLPLERVKTQEERWIPLYRWKFMKVSRAVDPTLPPEVPRVAAGIRFSSGGHQA